MNVINMGEFCTAKAASIQKEIDVLGAQRKTFEDEGKHKFAGILIKKMEALAVQHNKYKGASKRINRGVPVLSIGFRQNSDLNWAKPSATITFPNR